MLLQLVIQLLDSLPDLFRGCHIVHSATGAALLASFKLIVSWWNHKLPIIGAPFLSANVWILSFIEGKRIQFDWLMLIIQYRSS